MMRNYAPPSLFGACKTTFVPAKTAEPEDQSVDSPQLPFHITPPKTTTKRPKYLPGERLLQTLNKTRKKQKNKHISRVIESILADLSL
jgi:hypothetical protein